MRKKHHSSRQNGVVLSYNLPKFLGLNIQDISVRASYLSFPTSWSPEVSTAVLDSVATILNEKKTMAGVDVKKIYEAVWMGKIFEKSLQLQLFLTPNLRGSFQLPINPLSFIICRFSEKMPNQVAIMSSPEDSSYSISCHISFHIIFILLIISVSFLSTVFHGVWQCFSILQFGSVVWSSYAPTFPQIFPQFQTDSSASFDLRGQEAPVAKGSQIHER